MTHPADRSCQRCGTPLSRYNRELTCAPCARFGPAEAPLALWQLDGVRTALEIDDLASVFITYRRALELSQVDLANLLSDEAPPTFSQARVSRIEAGARVRDIDELRRIAEVLGIPPEMLGLAASSSFTDASLSVPPAATVTVDGAEVDGDMKRRTMLTGAAALVSYKLGASLRVSDRQVGTADLHQVDDALAQLWMLDDRYGGDGICRLAVGYLQRIHDMLNHGSYDKSTGVRLQVLAGRFAEHAGWLSYDAGRQDHARYLLTEALTAARLAPDDELEVLVLGTMSIQAGHVGRYREAVQLAQRAQECGAARRSPTVYAVAALREARAHALIQDAAAANNAMIRADRALSQAGSRPEWAAYFDEAEVAAVAGYCWAALGRPNKAISLFTTALERQRQPYRRNRALYSAYLAHAYLANHEVEQAAIFGAQALERADRVTSTRVLDQARSLRHKMARHRKTSAGTYIDQFDRRFTASAGGSS